MTVHPGRELGYQGAKRAADHAGEEWKRQAYAAFIHWWRKYDFFTTEEVRNGCNVPPPPDSRAWGHITQKAKKEGLIKYPRTITSPSRICHGRKIDVWKAIRHAARSASSARRGS